MNGIGKGPFINQDPLPPIPSSNKEPIKDTLTKLWEEHDTLQSLYIHGGGTFHTREFLEKRKVEIHKVKNLIERWSNLKKEGLNQTSSSAGIDAIDRFSKEILLKISTQELLDTIKERSIKENKLEEVPLDLKPANSGLEILEQMLTPYQGVAIGERHDHSVTDYLLKNIKQLEQLQIKTLFLEGVSCELQEELDAYLKEGSTSLLQKWRDKDQLTEKKIELIKAAREAGIRIVGMETQAVLKCSDNGIERIIGFNYVASEIIKQERGSHKYLILCGSRHLTSLYEGALPGIATLCQIPSIQIYKNEEKLNTTYRDLWSNYDDTLRMPSNAALTLEPVEKIQPTSSRSFTARSTLGLLTTQTWTNKYAWENLYPDLAKASTQFRQSQEADLPISDPLSEQKLKKAEQAFIICEVNQFTHLELPKIRLEGSSIVEEKTGTKKDTLASLNLYADNKEKFDTAVEEFLSFLCLTDSSNLRIGGQRDFIPRTVTHEGRFSQAIWPSYDKIALDEENGTGKIGFSELDNFKLKDKPPTEEDIKNAAEKAILLFPYHAEGITKKGYEILTKYVSQQLPSYEDFASQFKTKVDEQSKFFNFMRAREQTYETHGISFASYSSLPPIHPDTLQKLQNRIKVELLASRDKDGQVYPQLTEYVTGYEKIYGNDHQKTWQFKDISQQSWQKACTQLAEDIPTIVKQLGGKIKRQLERKAKDEGLSTISKEQLPNLRILHNFQRANAFADIFDDIDMEREDTGGIQVYSIMRQAGALQKIEDIILEELVNAGILQGFSPHALFC